LLIAALVGDFRPFVKVLVVWVKEILLYYFSSIAAFLREFRAYQMRYIHTFHVIPGFPAYSPFLWGDSEELFWRGKPSTHLADIHVVDELPFSAEGSNISITSQDVSLSTHQVAIYRAV